MQTGYIVAKAYTSDAQIPIQNATFTVLSTDKDNEAVLGVRLTDKSGKTEPIPIEAPDEALSTTPGNPEPYTTVNIRLDHPDYNSYYVEGVQIFAGQISLINAPMIPTAPHILYNKKADNFDTNSPNNLL